MHNLVKVMYQCEYSDPIVGFVDELTVKSVFEATQQRLSLCGTVLIADFFLCKQTRTSLWRRRALSLRNTAAVFTTRLTGPCIYIVFKIMLK